MTAEPDLLPLPEPAFRLKWRDGAYYVSEPNIGNTDCYTAEQVRACVSSATEALRAEVERLTKRDAEWNQTAGEEVSRAERLAEAGRRVTAAFRAHGSNITPDGGRTRAECEAAMLALDAALEQEAGR